MSLEQNKQVVIDWYERLSSGRTESALELLADDAVWWAASASPAGKTWSREQFCHMVAGFTDAFKSPLQTTIKTLTAEEDRVAAVVESFGQLQDGRTYNNVYHMLFIIRNGKIQQAYEHMNTLYIANLFGQEILD